VQLALVYGLENLGFLTLTFRDHVTCAREAQRRLNSLLSGVLRKRYRDYICAMERMESGRIHFHLLIVLDHDIRTGANFQQFKEQVYRSASPALRQEWAFWRKTAPLYRFGRTELMPIKSTTEALSKYVGKYVAKHIGKRLLEDKGVRLIRMSSGARVGTTRFAWNSPAAWVWRKKAQLFGLRNGCLNTDDLKEKFGRRWAYQCYEAIMRQELTHYPTAAHAQADGVQVPAGSTDIVVGRQQPSREALRQLLPQRPRTRINTGTTVPRGTSNARNLTPAPLSNGSNLTSEDVSNCGNLTSHCNLTFEARSTDSSFTHDQSDPAGPSERAGRIPSPLSPLPHRNNTHGSAESPEKTCSAALPCKLPCVDQLERESSDLAGTVTDAAAGEGSGPRSTLPHVSDTAPILNSWASGAGPAGTVFLALDLTPENLLVPAKLTCEVSRLNGPSSPTASRQVKRAPHL
jgi:hypothetical protein